MRWCVLAAAFVLVSCARDPVASGEAVGPAPTVELAVARERCTACHAAGAAAARRVGALPAPRLADVGARTARAWLEAKLATHHTAGADEAVDLAHFLVARTRGGGGLAAAEVRDAEVEAGARLWTELGCAVCHGTEERRPLEHLARKSDFGHLSAFLQAPSATRPDLGAHDFALDAREARALAGWLLARDGRSDRRLEPGIAWECFEREITAAGLPDLEGAEPVASGRVERIGVDVRTRDDHFVLRFTGTLEVPESGRWRFVTGSDDSSWLFVDGAMVVRNEGLAPHRRHEGGVELDAGAHDLTVVYTEAKGEESLEVLWQGPGRELAPIPAAALRAGARVLVPPAPATALDPARAARGERAFAARRCGACHHTESLPDPAPAPTWDRVIASGSVCPIQPASAAARPAVASSPRGPRGDAAQLGFLLERDGCLSCHTRDGVGRTGREEAFRELPVQEDLGEEGRLPPDLTAAGHRLRSEWIAGVLSGRSGVRHYTTLRMPRLSAADAAEYARLFEAVDAVPGDGEEPEFTADAVALGRKIAGTSGFACVTCHRLAGHEALGPQGMDLALQHARMKPAWFREWLLAPARHRPGTLMPAFWPAATPAAIAEIDALRVWLSLGAAIPLPDGIAAAGSQWVLESYPDRPRLHAAFLDGLSAKCIAVGTPERTHYAYDLAHQRLAWLWRGAFLSAEGTWSGRAGQLVRPLGDDHVVLPAGCPFELVAGSAEPRMLGRRIDTDGYPIWRIGLGTVEVQDAPRPRWTAHGSELVRRVTVLGGAVRMRLPAPGGDVQVFVDGDPRAEVVVPDGATVDLVYRW